VAEAERHPEAVPEGCRQEAGAGGGADEGERRQVERQGPGSRALPETNVEAEVLERRVEDLLRGAIEPMDLVDEENVARLERGEDRGGGLRLRAWVPPASRTPRA